MRSRVCGMNRINCIDCTSILSFSMPHDDEILEKEEFVLLIDTFMKYDKVETSSCCVKIYCKNIIITLGVRSEKILFDAIVLWNIGFKDISEM